MRAGRPCNPASSEDFNRRAVKQIRDSPDARYNEGSVKGGRSMMSTDPITFVESLRAEGRTIASACRAAGISASTYYRRRREASGAAITAEAPQPEIRFARADPLLARELTDSVVHRIAGPSPITSRACPDSTPLRLRQSLAHAGLPEEARLLLRVAMVAVILALLGSAAGAVLTAMSSPDAAHLAALGLAAHI
jgi:putative intracellular protease/amidase